MLPSVTQAPTRGWTLTETIIVVVIAATLLAIGLPSFFSYLARYRVNDGLARVRAALQTAQREAMRRGQSCTVSLPSGGNTVSGACLRGADSTVGGVPTMILPGSVILTHNLSGGATNTVAFNFRGRNVSSGTIIISASDNSTAWQRCLVLNPGVGLMRSGTWSGSTCTTTDQ
uniref:Type IV pilin protein, putative n=1 Tax=Cyanothece sp. (strain PCC 7425 / ATCC 29141) TaxID=395961 RepID=B8HQ00_CYAP4